MVMIKKSGRYDPQLCNENTELAHLRKHLHLTNCIHLKHHTRMSTSETLQEFNSDSNVSLLKESSALQWSPSLRDPSTNPNWGYSLRKVERETKRFTHINLLLLGDDDTVDDAGSLERSASVADHGRNAVPANNTMGSSDGFCKEEEELGSKVLSNSRGKRRKEATSSEADIPTFLFNSTNQKTRDASVQRKRKTKRKRVPHLKASLTGSYKESREKAKRDGDGRIPSSISGRSLHFNPILGKVFRGYQSFLGGIKASTVSDSSDSTFNMQNDSISALKSVTSSLDEQVIPQREDHVGRIPASKPCSLERERWAADAASGDVHGSISQRYMPKSFCDIVGQNLVTHSLSNVLLKGKAAPIYIFYGPRGTGKTTCAKIFAMALNCLSTEKERPCYSCRACAVQKLGRNKATIKDVNAAEIYEVRDIKGLFDDFAWSISSSRYKVCIVNDCHMLSEYVWNALIKIMGKASREAVFILSTSSIEQLPRTVVSRCQKFPFSKIKESKILRRLETIALQEGLNAGREALQLISSSCDGSLGDAEVILDQLRCLEVKITPSVVQELVGLIPEEELVELLDFALSADTVNTVRSVRGLVESGTEPLNLMSQLAYLITKILAGECQVSKRKVGLQFFRKAELSREDMERLRQALKMLSEAEKQLRASSDRSTWLIAALLQLAPNHCYIVRCSTNTVGRWKSEIHTGANETHGKSKQQSTSLIMDSEASHLPGLQSPGKSHTIRGSDFNGSRSTSSALHVDYGEPNNGPLSLRNEVNVDDVWQSFLDAVHSNSLRKFLKTQGKLLSVSFHKGSAVAYLEFCHPEYISRAEQSRASIAHAFQASLGGSIEIKMHLILSGQIIPGAQPVSSTTPSPPLWSPDNRGGCSKGMVAKRDNANETDDPPTTIRPQKPLRLELCRDVHTHHASSQSNTEGSFLHISSSSGAPAQMKSGCPHRRHASGKDQGLMDAPINLEVVIQQTEATSVKGCNEDTEFLCVLKSVNQEHLKDGLLSPEHVAVEVPRPGKNDFMKESTSGGILCWKSTSQYGREVLKQLYPCLRRRKFFSSLFPCAKYYSSS